MSNDDALASDEVYDGSLISKVSAYFRKRSRESQNRSDLVPESKPAVDAIAAVTPTIRGHRLKRLTPTAIKELIDLHEDIAIWYILDFLRQTGGLEEQAEMLSDLESRFGADFLRSYTKRPVAGDIHASFEPNFWFLQGKIHMLMWLLGRDLTDPAVNICCDEILPSDFNHFE